MGAAFTDNILALDTATAIFSVALGTPEGNWYCEADAGTHHSRLLMDITDFLFKKSGLKPADLSRVFCMRGPGSFTGLRIGFSSAKALALSLNIPFTAVSSLDCIAYPYSIWPGLVIPLIDARKKSWFCALYAGGCKLVPDIDADADAIISEISAQKPEYKQQPVLLTGPDADKFYSEITEKTENEANIAFTLAPCSRYGSARELLAIAKTQKKINNSINYNCGPEYLRKSDAEINSGKQIKNV